ncbi:MAG TPA: DUF4911 domain-containing protein [Syntrophomonadaceae bacterium]|nr:DUF4911 domain-containing protein [Syntrophomonadaceae bacterium]
MKHEIYLQLAPEKIDLLTRLIEAYNHLGIVSTLDRQKGKVVVRVTPDTYHDVYKILQHLPFPIQIL